VKRRRRNPGLENWNELRRSIDKARAAYLFAKSANLSTVAARMADWEKADAALDDAIAEFHRQRSVSEVNTHTSNEADRVVTAVKDEGASNRRAMQDIIIGDLPAEDDLSTDAEMALLNGKSNAINQRKRKLRERKKAKAQATPSSSSTAPLAPQAKPKAKAKAAVGPEDEALAREAGENLIAHLFTKLDGIEPKQVLPGVIYIPGFLQAFKLTPTQMLEMLTNIPEHPSDQDLALNMSDDAAPILVRGTHKALQYRGNAIPRNKSFNQLNMNGGCLRYGYTGWQYRIALAHRSTKALPLLHTLIEAINQIWDGPEFNHAISTLYETGDDNIGDHDDKPQDIDDDSWILVVKLGAPRPFEIKQGKNLVWSESPEPGSAILMNLTANKLYKHGVPKVENTGLSASIVLRRIKTVLAWNHVEWMASKPDVKKSKK
jgi:alkylated DNA repair dioxygenase AlkB